MKPIIRCNASKRLTIFLLGLLITCSGSIAYSQVLDYSASTTEHWFDRKVGLENSGVLNGQRYKVEFRGETSDPFFGSGLTNGSVTYKKQRYHAPLLYDIFQDQLVIKHINLSGAVWFVQLDKSVVSDFVLGQHRFKNYNGVYYDVLFEGSEFSLVCKRAKLATVRNRIRNYIEDNQYYIIRSNVWQRFSNVSSLNRILKTKVEREKLRSYLSQEGIKKRSKDDKLLVKAAIFVNDLLRQSHP